MTENIRPGFERDVKDLASHLEKAQIVFDKTMTHQEALEKFHHEHHATIAEFIRKKIESAPQIKAPLPGTYIPKASAGSGASIHDVRSALEELVELALDKGIVDAAQVAKKMGPYFTDLLHDSLIGEFYDEFVRRGKINPVSL